MVNSRRGFLKLFTGPSGHKEALRPALRPPYAHSESLFYSKCEACDDKACVASCEEEIITLKEDGTPTLSFDKSGCTFCDACAKACKHGVLDLSNSEESYTINAHFRIDTQQCIAHHQVICSACKDPCVDDAIIFQGLFNPTIDSRRCTGCGFCIMRCPTYAIAFFTVPIKNEQTTNKETRG